MFLRIFDASFVCIWLFGINVLMTPPLSHHRHSLWAFCPFSWSARNQVRGDIIRRSTHICPIQNWYLQQQCLVWTASSASVIIFCLSGVVFVCLFFVWASYDVGVIRHRPRAALNERDLKNPRNRSTRSSCLCFMSIALLIQTPLILWGWEE